MAKSLLGKTSTPKKQKAKREITDKSIPYKFAIGDSAIYKGYGYENEPCTIVSRSRKYIQDYYKIRFVDSDDIIETVVNILITIEEFQQEQEENKYLEINPEFMNKNLNNPMCCHNQGVFAEMRCHECQKEKECVYRNKYNYKKLDIW